MLLGLIPMFCFEILRIFGEKSQKSKTWKSGYFGLLRRSIGNPRCGVRRPTPRHGMPRQGKAEVPKWHPSGTPRHIKAMPRRRPMIYIAVLCRGVAIVHKGQNFGFFFRKSSFCTPIV